MKKFKIGLCQMMVTENSKKENIDKARKMICEAADKGAKIVSLPEMFNCPYDNKNFRKYAEGFKNGETINMLSDVAKEKDIYLVGGSIPELDDEGKVYNTSFIFNNKGILVGKHRKIHLFDIDVKNKISFKESEVLTGGKDITIIETEYGKIGVAICYDIRFPELIRIMALKGAKIVFVPAAFNMTTGPAHWETLFKSRALDNEIYVAGISPARNMNYSYVAYGNSLVANPWGNIINKLDENEGIIIEEIDLDYIEEVREAIPVFKHRREDIYGLDLI
ncbi:carbon-nitrogen hydrolase family protein [Clostridiaceae bacterium UIB06]|uniref:Carbon-nitrogen hydrolase family protein n=1 Tax=Clostridium thailandense TaxID=2794346 RepID=A0A949WWI5_9CLOT|nr:carbon-nitrogen hydrolase family protein [Clostridium thailandense]MBV7274852.1 carbon-nitrogen hydrolase family protein [Clostridium thailandense]MCH5137597.1 carbon-nitrogen hydrolase family protein [Clostridiaceae bacterium UIB06]